MCYLHSVRQFVYPSVYHLKFSVHFAGFIAARKTLHGGKFKLVKLFRAVTAAFRKNLLYNFSRCTWRWRETTKVVSISGLDMWEYLLVFKLFLFPCHKIPGSFLLDREFRVSLSPGIFRWKRINFPKEGISHNFSSIMQLYH